MGDSLPESCGQVVIAKNLLAEREQEEPTHKAGSSYFTAPPLTPSLHPETAPTLALWVGVCFRILPQREYLITWVLFFKLISEVMNEAFASEMDIFGCL